MQPINYSMDIQDPSQAFLSAFQTGSAITQSRLAQEQAVRQGEQQQRMTAAFERLRQPGATAKDYADLAMQLPETQAKAVRESFGMISQDQQQNALMNSGKVFAAFKSGQPEIAINLMEQQIAAKRNSGDEEGAKFLETWRDVTKENPQSTEDYFGFTLSQMPGGDKIIESAVKFGAERRTDALQPAALQKAQAEATQAEQKALNAVATARDDIAKSEAQAQLAIAQADKAKVEAKFAEQTQIAGLNKSNWDIKNLQNQISDRSARLNLDRQTTEATVAEKMSSIRQNLTELPIDARKLVNEAVTESAVARQSSDQLLDLSKRIEASGGGFGAFTSLGDAARRGLGFQNGSSQLRQEYTRLRNTSAIKALPPGPATDKDLELALRGFPPENADASQVASFLRGMAKLQDIEANVGNAKADWLANNRGVLTRAQTPFMAGNYATKQGESFVDFQTRVVQDVSKKYDPRQQTSLVEQIPTDQNPQPRAAENNIRSQADAILRGGQ